MKKILLKSILFSLFMFVANLLSAQRVDVSVNGGCTCCTGGGMSFYLTFSGGSTSPTYSASPGTSVTCIVVPVGNTVTDVTFIQTAGGCSFSLGGVNVAATTCGTCFCGCLNGSRTFSSTYSVGGGSVCPPTADVMTLTVN